MDGPIDRSLTPGDGRRVVPGGATQIEIASSLRAVINEHRAQQVEYGKALKDMRAEAHMMASLGGVDEQKLAAAVAAGVRAAMQERVPQRPTSESSTGQVIPAHDRPQEPQNPFPGLVAPSRDPYQRNVNTPRGWNTSPDHGQTALQSLRKLAADRVAEHAQNWTFGGAPVGEHVMGYYNLSDYDAGMEGPGIYRVLERLDTNAVISEEGARTLSHRMAAADAARRMISTMGEAKTISGGLQAMLPRVAKGLGVGSLAVGAGLQLADFAQQQREANLPFQRVLGGSNFEGFGERFNEQLFQWRSFLGSGMSNRNSEALYRGAMELAPQNDYARDQIMDVGLDLYRSVGMSPQETLKIINVAIENSNWGIRQIANSLESVTRTARDAGLNAQEAREQFTQTFEAMSGIVIGPGATQAAQVATQGNLALGRIGEGLGVTPNDLMQYQVAGMLGVDINRANAMLGGSGTDQRAYWGAVEEVQRRFSQGLITPEGQAMIDEQIVQGGGSFADLTPREVEDIVRRLQYEGGLAPISALQNRWRAQGMNLSADEAVRQTLLAQYGGMQYEEQAGQVNSEAGPVDGGFSSGLQVINELDIGLGQNGNWDNLSRGIEEGNEEGLWGSGRAAALYNRAVQTYGRRLPFIEEMIRNYDSEGSARFTVQTAGGQVIVGLHELLRDFYPQAMAGHVEVVGNSSYIGQSTSQILGASSEALIESYGSDFEEALHASEAQDYSGRTFDADSLGGENATTVRLYIESGPRLNDFISVSAAGDPRVDVQYGAPSTSTMPSSSAPHG